MLGKDGFQRDFPALAIVQSEEWDCLSFMRWHFRFFVQLKHSEHSGNENNYCRYSRSLPFPTFPRGWLGIQASTVAFSSSITHETPYKCCCVYKTM